jgi:hypothetical protein
MMKVVGVALAFAVGATGFAFAKDDDDDKVPAAEATKIAETLSTLGCSGYGRSRRRSRASTKSKMPNARWALSISSSTRTTP